MVNEVDTKSEEKKLRVIVDGQELEISGRAATQLENLVSAQKEAKFAKDRTAFSNDASGAIYAMIEDMSDEQLAAIEGMKLVIDISGNDDPLLVDSGKVTIRQRAPKAVAVTA